MSDYDGTKPTFEQIKDALMPPGTDNDALWAALKNAQRTGGHVPGRPAPDISGSLSDLPPTVRELIRTGHITKDQLPRLAAELGDPVPPDPFTKGSEAAAGLAEMYEDLVASGIPLASVERILGAMLATYGAMTKDEP